MKAIRTALPVIGILLILSGTGWFLQGIGVLTTFKSFMVGNPLWAVIGAAFVIGGAALVAFSVRTRSKTS